MKLFRHFRPFIILVACFVPGCGEDAESPTIHAKSSLLGTWRLVTIGEKKLADSGVQIRWTFNAEELVVSDDSGEVISRSAYHIDTAPTPHHITMEIRDIAQETRPGIFEIDGNTVRISFTIDGNARPANFVRGEVLTLERVVDSELP